MAGHTYLATYTPDPRAVLATVDPRLEARHAASPAIAWLWGFKAKAHAVLGDRESFELAISKAHSALDASPSERVQPGIFSFLPEKLAFYEARGLVEFDRLLGPSSCEAVRDWRKLLASLRPPQLALTAATEEFV